MEILVRAGQCFYGIGLIGIGIQQFLYDSFRPMLLPSWSNSLPNVSIWAYSVGAALVVTGLLIMLNKQARIAAIILGGIFFLFFLYHAYDQLTMLNDEFQLAAWTNPLKVLTFSGGAFIVAGSLADEGRIISNRKLLLCGRIFFAVMLIVFGIDHFLYARFVALLVPPWLPGALFWTYFSAVALIVSGLFILLNIKNRQVAFLCGLMLFLWLVVLHIPRAIAYPSMAEGNEITSAFQALAFSGIAFMLSRAPFSKLSGRND